MLGDLVFLDVPTRVANHLLALAETHSTGNPGAVETIDIPIGQEELARLVGASRETVSCALNS